VFYSYSTRALPSSSQSRSCSTEERRRSERESRTPAGRLPRSSVSVHHGFFGYVERQRGPWQETAGGLELSALVLRRCRRHWSGDIHLVREHRQRLTPTLAASALSLALAGCGLRAGLAASSRNGAVARVAPTMQCLDRHGQRTVHYQIDPAGFTATLVISFPDQAVTVSFAVSDRAAARGARRFSRKAPRLRIYRTANVMFFALQPVPPRDWRLLAACLGS
jgi:hypothetical protein